MKITFTSAEEKEQFARFLQEYADPMEIEMEEAGMEESDFEEVPVCEDCWRSAWEDYQLDMLEYGNLSTEEVAEALGVTEDAAIHMLAERSLERFLDEELDQVGCQELWGLGGWDACVAECVIRDRAETEWKLLEMGTLTAQQIAEVIGIPITKVIMIQSITGRARYKEKLCC